MEVSPSDDSVEVSQVTYEVINFKKGKRMIFLLIFFFLEDVKCKQLESFVVPSI